MLTNYKKSVKILLREEVQKMGNEVITAITTVGFPIVSCLAMAWFVYDQTEKHRKEVITLNENHKKEIEQITLALNNNTIALTRLCDKMERD